MTGNPEGVETKDSNRYVYTSVLSSTVHGSQKQLSALQPMSGEIKYGVYMRWDVIQPYRVGKYVACTTQIESEISQKQSEISQKQKDKYCTILLM